MIHYTLEKDGFCGDYFPGTVYKDKAILYFQGMSVKEAQAIRWSKPLREQGYNVMCMGYYLWKGLPKYQYDTPIEYVERAIAVLKKKGIKDFCIHGISGSSRYVLEAALHISDISCVISIVPYDYITEGLKHNLFHTGRSIYTYRNKPIPYMTLDCLDHGVRKALGRFFREEDHKLPHMARWSYVVQENYDENARIKIENLKARLLLMAPDFDDTWPSDQAVVRMEKVLEEKHFAYPYEVHVYQNASHCIGIRMTEKEEKSVRNVIPREKQNLAGARAGREQSVSDLLRFVAGWMEES